MLTVVRHIALILTVVAACATPAGASVATPVVTPGTASSAAARSDGGRAPTPAQARAFGRAVNLTAADAPGFKPTSEGGNERETPAEKKFDRQLSRCAGGVGTKHQVADVQSKAFEREGHGEAQRLQSGVSIEQTPALAAKDLAAVRSKRARRCISHYASLVFQGHNRKGTHFGKVSVSAGSPPAPGTTGSFALRLTSSVTARGTRIPFYLDILGFVVGPAEVTLFTISLPGPFPAATEEQLFSLLVGRAKAHPI
jgi:hypothetical protein